MSNTSSPRPAASKPPRSLNTLSDLRSNLMEALATDDDLERRRKVLEVIFLPGPFVPSREELLELRTHLFRLPSPKEVAHQIVVRWVDKNPSSELPRRLARSLCDDDRARLAFPTNVATPDDAIPYGDRVTAWVDALELEARDEKTKARTLDVDLALAAWRCLARDHDQIHFQKAALRLAMRCLSRPGGGLKNSTAWLFAGEKQLPGNSRKLAPLLTALSAKRDKATAEADSAKKALQVEVDRASNLTHDLAQAKIAWAELEAQAEDLHRALDQAQDEVAKLRIEADQRERHARDTADAEWRQLVRRIKDRLSHETAELTLCLNRPQPNISMALDRVRNLDSLRDDLGSGSASPA